ncbi:dihydrofolate reductase [Pokkaliibacter sp. CJK22405]|uniref:dihydrofolate reductase n=1 Tax=Pokkaliibacter sp. CJK22405 TaxID=3384615 RepID=UPI00398470BA
MKVAAIVATSLNGVIGVENRLPWHIPEDLKYFRRVTMGKPVLMGRNTFDSIGRALPGRTNIVLTRNPEWQHEGVVVAHELDEALEQAKAAAQKAGAEEVMIMGGAQLYNTMLPHCDRLYLTRVHTQIEGDAFFPDVNPLQWQEVSRESLGATDERPACDFLVLERIA